MKPLGHTLRLAVLVLLAALLLAALPQIVGLALAFLIPIWFFFTAVTSSPAPDLHQRCDIRPFPFVPVFSPRPPPIS
jgi:hypothetical protein